MRVIKLHINSQELILPRTENFLSNGGCNSNLCEPEKEILTPIRWKKKYKEYDDIWSEAIEESRNGNPPAL